MAADRAGPYPLRRPLVLAILAIAARRRRAAGRARVASRPYDRAALGAALRSRTGATHTATSQADQQSWRMDETYVRVRGRWCYLYRAVDSAGATIDFLLSALRDADAAKRLFRKALSDRSHPQPRVINTDLAPIYRAAIADTKKEGILRRRCQHRPVQYLNNILEQDHRAIKRRVNAKQGFREFQAASRTIQGYEAMNMIRKAQIRWVSGDDVLCQIRFIRKLFDLAT